MKISSSITAVQKCEPINLIILKQAQKKLNDKYIW